MKWMIDSIGGPSDLGVTTHPQMETSNWAKMGLNSGQPTRSSTVLLSPHNPAHEKGATSSRVVDCLVYGQREDDKEQLFQGPTRASERVFQFEPTDAGRAAGAAHGHGFGLKLPVFDSTPPPPNTQTRPIRHRHSVRRRRGGHPFLPGEDAALQSNPAVAR